MAIATKSARSGDDIEPLRLRFGAFELNEADARLVRDGHAVPLAPRPFAVLCALARQPGQLVTKNALLDAVWGHQHVTESVLKTIISELRAALSDDAKQPRYIETASRRGYRFIAATSPLRAQDLTASSPASTSDAEANTQRIETPLMIGRGAALARLRTAWSNAIGGRRQVFWIGGEAGVGKTTLIDAFVAGLGPVACARGQCVEQYGTGEPYLPVFEALADLCRIDPALSPLLRAVAPMWLLQLPWLSGGAERETLRRELGGASQDRMLREAGELLERYTRDRPLLLVTEDLHWSDHATVHLMNHIARRRGPARLMWLASFRLAEAIAEDHPLKALRHELRLHRLCDEILLEPFSEQELADFIADRAPQSHVSESFVRALHVRTEGLPLFVANVMDDLVAQGVLDAESDETTDELRIESLTVPENLAGIIEKRIARLSPEQRALLEAASVCGVDFRASAVAAALERDARGVEEACDELAHRQYWLSRATVDRLADGSLDARYSFRHALYRHVFYQRIGPLARAQLHRRVATSLERARAGGVTATAAELASHYELGGEVSAALRHYAEAAESALRHFAPGEARRLAAHALELLARAPAGTQGPLQAALELALAALLGVSEAQVRGISSLEAKSGFERARALLETMPQHPLRGLVLHGLGLVLMVRGEYAAARALGERACALSAAHGDRVPLICGCNVLGQIATLQGDPPQARSWLEQGVLACEELSDDAMQAAFVIDPGVTMQATLAVALLHEGLIEQGRARVKAAHDRARRLGQPIARMIAAWFNLLFEIRLGDAGRAAALVDDLKTVVEDAGLAHGRAAYRWFRGWVQVQHGQAPAGYRQIREAFDYNASRGMFSGGTEVLGYAAEAQLQANDWAAAQGQLDEALQLGQRLGERVYLPQLLLLKARIALGRGDPASAREAVQAAVCESRAQKALWLELLCLIALCELDPATGGDLGALADAYARLPEGLDTAPARRAAELLQARARATSRT